MEPTIFESLRHKKLFAGSETRKGVEKAVLKLYMGVV